MISNKSKKIVYIPKSEKMKMESNIYSPFSFLKDIQKPFIIGLNWIVIQPSKK